MVVEPSGIQASVTGAIRQAAQATGTDFHYLLATARVESNLNPNAKVSTSSARGLFQFIEQTWLATLKKQGPALGYGPYADAISRLPSGKYAVTDPRLHDAIMNLREDPAANAAMAGAYTRVNAERLANRLGRHPSGGELYIAHFLGAAGAGRLIELAGLRPNAPAAAVFPGAARANPAIFYDHQGRPRSAVDVYSALVGRYEVARGEPANSVTIVAASTAEPVPQATLPPPLQATLPLPQPTAPPPQTIPLPPPLQLVQNDRARALVPIENTMPMFRDLFHSGPTRGPVAPVVSALWSTRAEASGATLDLFQDQTPDARALFRGKA